MEEKTASSQASTLVRLARICLAVLPVLAVHVWLARGSAGVSPDSVFFWSAARTFAAQGKLATGIAMDAYLEHLPDGPGTERPPTRWSSDGLYPFSAWPPGYP